MNFELPLIISGRYASLRQWAFDLIGSRVEPARLGEDLQLKRSSPKEVDQRTSPRETLRSKDGYLWATAFVEGGSGQEACLGLQGQEVSTKSTVIRFIRHPELV